MADIAAALRQSDQDLLPIAHPGGVRPADIAADLPHLAA